MTHAELSEVFKRYHQETWPERRIFPNRSGVAVYGKSLVPYGIPAPLLGKKKKAGGGGSDFISLGPEGGYFTAWFFEVKTLNDTMKPNQRRWAKWVVSQGGKYWIVKEQPDRCFKLIAIHSI